jgi:hypothetical protein
MNTHDTTGAKIVRNFGLCLLAVAAVTYAALYA